MYSPHTRPKYFEKIYSKQNYQNIFYKNYNEKYLNSVKYIKNYIHNDAIFLDYGCGSGYFMKALDSYGYKSVGIDYDKNYFRSKERF